MKFSHTSMLGIAAGIFRGHGFDLVKVSKPHPCMNTCFIDFVCVGSNEVFTHKVQVESMLGIVGIFRGYKLSANFI